MSEKQVAIAEAIDLGIRMPGSGGCHWAYNFLTHPMQVSTEIGDTCVLIGFPCYIKEENTGKMASASLLSHKSLSS